MLPGVVYLEMARAAVVRATGIEGEVSVIIRIKNVVWIKPIVIDGKPVRVYIVLVPMQGGAIDFTILSRPYSNNGDPVMHSQGSASIEQPQELPRLDCAAIEADCSLRLIDARLCYETFGAMGLSYGPAFRVIERIHVGDRRVLAELHLPETVSDTFGRFVLHPSMMDAAQQSAIGLMMHDSLPEPSLPFALDELWVYGACTETMRCFVRRSEGSKDFDRMLKLNIDLCDSQGNIRVKIKGFTSRVSDRSIDASKSGQTIIESDETTQFNDEFYKSLIEGIEQGEISKEQMKTILELRSGGENG